MVSDVRGQHGRWFDRANAAILSVLIVMWMTMSPPAAAQYIAPPTRPNGTVITAAIWNQDLVANEIALAATANDATIVALAGVVTSADKLIYATAADTFTVATLTNFARTILDDTTGGAVMTTLGISAFAQTILDDTSSVAVQTTLGLASTFAPTTDVDVNINAGTTNRNVNLNPTGTGKVVVASGKTLTTDNIGTTADANIVITAGATNRSVNLTPTGTGKVAVASGKSITVDTVTPTSDSNLLLQAGATNRDVTLTPTGTGVVALTKSLNLFGTPGNPASLRNIHYDATAKIPVINTDVDASYRLMGCVFQNDANSTAITATGGADFDVTYTPDVNGCYDVVGRRVRVRTSGTVTSDASPGTLAFQLKLGGTGISTGYTIALTASKTAGWFFEQTFIVRSTGASGTVIREGIQEYVDYDVGTNREGNSFFGTASTITVDLTGAPAIALSANLSAAGDSITLNTMAIFIER